VGADLFHVGGRTDRHDEIVAFRNFANEPKNDISGKITVKNYQDFLLQICGSDFL